MHQAESWRGRPTSTWLLIVLDLGAVALCLYGAVAPLTPSSPAALNGSAAGLGAALVIALWWRGDRAATALIHVNLVVFLVATTVLIASAATGEGALSAASSYLLVSLYAAVYFPRRTMRVYVGVAVVLLAGAIAASEVVISSVVIWLPPAVSCVAGAEVLSRLTTHLRWVGVTDSLTGLPNRAGFLQAVTRERLAAARTSAPLTLAVVDLDGLKKVNDLEGHAAGDRLLGAVAHEWRTGLRPRDTVFRLGGDEFAFLLPDTGEAAAAVLMQRLQADSASSWSYGIARLPEGDQLEPVLALADRRMYLAKHAADKAGFSGSQG